MTRKVVVMSVGLHPPGTPRLYRPVPGTSAAKGETRPIADRRPIYLTPDGRTMPHRRYGTTPTGAVIIAIADYEMVRDRLFEVYGPVEVTHDDVIYADGDRLECWPACRGAETLWWACLCPCGGSTHGGEDNQHFLGYTLETERLAGTITREPPGKPPKTYDVRRRTFTFRNPASRGGHLHAV